MSNPIPTTPDVSPQESHLVLELFKRLTEVADFKPALRQAMGDDQALGILSRLHRLRPDQDLNGWAEHVVERVEHGIKGEAMRQYARIKTV